MSIITTQLIEIKTEDGVDVINLSSAGITSSVGSADSVLGILQISSVDVSRTLEGNVLSFEIPTLRLPVGHPSTSFMSRLIKSPDYLVDLHIRLTVFINLDSQVLFTGKINTCEFSQKSIKVTASSYTQDLSFGQVYRMSTGCRNALGDNNCRVNLSLYTVTRPVISVSGSRLDVTTTNTLTADQFANGFLTITTFGEILRRDIAFNSTDTLYIFDPLPDIPLTAFTMSLTLGCTKDEARCKFFNNFANFGGVPENKRFFPGKEAFIASTKNLRP
jgi:hypothetical protein